jgi:hypothetical protein
MLTILIAAAGGGKKTTTSVNVYMVRSMIALTMSLLFFLSARMAWRQKEGAVR